MNFLSCYKQMKWKTIDEVSLMKNSVVALVREKNVIVINNEDNKKNDSNKMNKKKTVIYDQSFFMFDSES